MKNILEKLFAMSESRFENENRIYISALPEIARIFASGDKSALASALAKGMYVISDTKAEAQEHTLKEYTLYACRSIKPKTADGGMISGKDRPEAVSLMYSMASSLGLSLTEDEIQAFSIAHGSELYLWNDGGICALSRVAFRGGSYARINTVMTAPDKRGKGYAGALVSALSSEILKDGLVPTVLADKDNPISNAMYLSLGFSPEGTVFEYIPKGVKPRENAILYF